MCVKYILALNPGAACNLSISFKPTETGALTGTVTLEDNTLNLPGSTQSGSLTGTGIVGPAAPHLTAISVNYGASSLPVTLTGVNFGVTQGTSTVTFNGSPLLVKSWSSTSIVVTVPVVSTQTSGNIIVTVATEPSNATAFIAAPAPSISAISPTSGPVGTTVNILGYNLIDVENQAVVTFDGQSLPILEQGPYTTGTDFFQVAVPTGAVTGVFHVVVNNIGLDTPVFTFTGTSTVPSLSSDYGAPFADISLTGINLGAAQGSSTVTFNGVPAPVLAWSNSSVTVSVPYRATTGNVVATVAGHASNAIPFTLEPSGTITSMSPTSGPVGTMVTITGTNLIDAQGRGSVWIGNIQVPVISQSATSVKVQIPDGATTTRSISTSTA